jgi:hypothetical protein
VSPTKRVALSGTASCFSRSTHWEPIVNNLYSVTFTNQAGEEHTIKVIQQTVVRAVRFVLVFHHAAEVKDVQFLKTIDVVV